jgi:pimeloyl-ACP methyl ester carboxylesterase
VFLHGDVSTGGPVDYIYRVAEMAIAEGMVAVAVLRPGYGDSHGHQSTGDNSGRRDSYTAHNIDAVADAIKALKAHHQPERTVLIGHSGGAAISGVILGRHASLVDAAALIACPCHVPQWRLARGGRAWAQSLSPHAYVGKVPVATSVLAVMGDADDTTPLALGKDYVAELTRRGVSARMVAIPGAGHNDILRKPEVAVLIRELAMGARLGRPCVARPRLGRSPRRGGGSSMAVLRIESDIARREWVHAARAGAHLVPVAADPAVFQTAPRWMRKADVYVLARDSLAQPRRRRRGAAFTSSASTRPRTPLSGCGQRGALPPAQSGRRRMAARGSARMASITQRQTAGA